MGSGDFLMGALHRAGFANIPTAQRVDDGLTLTDVFIAAAVRCAPPDNKPAPEEIANCLAHLDAEVSALPRRPGRRRARAHRLRRLSAAACGAAASICGRRPAFGHGLAHALPNGQTLIGCYHPSRQNTNTGKLNARMMDEVFAKAALALRTR